MYTDFITAATPQTWSSLVNYKIPVPEEFWIQT